jgi:hypothetical protein
MDQDKRKAIYVVFKIELASGWRLAGFSIVKSEQNQPNDRDVILHIFKTYLSEMHTDVTPPLVDVSTCVTTVTLIALKETTVFTSFCYTQPPMDLLRFLVAYVWATPK